MIDKDNIEKVDKKEGINNAKFRIKKLYKNACAQKKIIIPCLVTLIICLISIPTITLAYFSDISQTETNIVTLGDITTKIEEDVYRTGAIINKDVVVTNTDVCDCLVRVRVTPSSSTIKPTIAVDEKNWILKDGFYYYQGILEAGRDNNGNEINATTSKTPKIPIEIGGIIGENGKIIDGLDLSEFSVTVYQESIQVVTTDSKGDYLSALDNGQYSQVNADKLWELYEATDETTLASGSN